MKCLLQRSTSHYGMLLVDKRAHQEQYVGWCGSAIVEQRAQRRVLKVLAGGERPGRCHDRHASLARGRRIVC